MKKKVCIILAVVVILIVLATGIYCYIQKMNRENAIPTISLIGEQSLTIALNDEYTDQGATATRNDADITDSVVKEGEVDTATPGEYKIKYKAYSENKSNSAEIERTVVVKDETSPTIELKGKKEVTVYVGNKYTDEGCTATDNFDGDITDKVSVTGEVNTDKEGQYEIKYTVEDSSKNIAEATRKVTVKKKPTISSSSGSTTSSGGSGLPVLMYHFFYDASAGEKGADNNWMEVSDFEEQMKYLADNNFYFPSWQEVEDYIDKKKTLPSKSVVVTIDDGDESFIKYAIPIIEKYNVKATSFVVTSWNGSWLPGQYRSSHLNFQSHSHDAHRAGANGKGRLVNLSYKDALDDVKKSKDIIGNCTVFCYPFGHYNDTAIKALQDSGYKLAFTTQGGRVKPGANKYKLPRVRMSKGISMSAFKSSVN